MNRVVYNAFKAVALSIIFIVIWSLAFYLMKVYSLNQKIESVMSTMQQEVSKNNYLPESTYDMYEAMLVDLATNMNGTNDTFVLGFNINYEHESKYTPTGTGDVTYVRQLNTAGNYGDIAVIELEVYINALSWTYNRSVDGAMNQVEPDSKTITMTYTYQVPCLRYISITG